MFYSVYVPCAIVSFVEKTVRRFLRFRVRKIGNNMADQITNLMEEIYKAANGALPNMAKILLPPALSEQTKRKILRKKKSPEEMAQIFVSAIDEINHGSIETVDTLVRRSL